MTEINKEIIDKNGDNFIDTQEITGFIFDKDKGETNLNDLGNYLNNLERNNNDQILMAINEYFNNSEEWKKTNGIITKKLNANEPLNKCELSLIYINMISNKFGPGQTYFNFLEGKLSNDELKFDVNKPINQICNGKLIKFIKEKYFILTYNPGISEDIFQQLLQIEGSQGYVSQIISQFGEKFPTGPYGMVYKHIDKNGNLLKTPIPFKNGEKVTKERALNNAKAYYNKRAQERKDLLNKKGYEYNQAQLDSLVSASGGTQKSVDRLKNFVLSHRENPQEISEFISKFAITAAGNGQVQPGLIIRRQFESNWFNGIQKGIDEYQREYYKNRTRKKSTQNTQKRYRKYGRYRRHRR